MEKSKAFQEGKQHALDGGDRLPHPYVKKDFDKEEDRLAYFDNKENRIAYSDWRKGWYEGYREFFDNSPAEDRAKHWEAKWRQSELERHIVMRSLSHFVTMGYEKEKSKEYIQDAWDEIVYQSEDKTVTITVGDCEKAEHLLLKYQCADIKEIDDYDEREWKKLMETLDDSQ